MHKLILPSMTVLLMTGLTLTLAAQQQRLSPHEKVSIDVGRNKITITYGRPYMKGRKIFGGLEPYDKVWRTGADEATTLETTADLQIGGLKVPKGTYALFTIPGENGWKLIVNKTAKQWGAFEYKQADDLGRVDMKVTRTAQPVEQFTISLSAGGQDQAVLTMAWENTSSSVAIKVGP
jgi:hypothetical protein